MWTSFKKLDTLWSTIRLSYYDPITPQQEGFPLSTTWGRAGQLCGSESLWPSPVPIPSTSPMLFYWKLAFMNSRKIEGTKNCNTSCLDLSYPSQRTHDIFNHVKKIINIILIVLIMFMLLYCDINWSSTLQVIIVYCFSHDFVFLHQFYLKLCF
jgi:hypothetical protein